MIAALRSVEQLDCQQILELPNPPAHGRMVEFQFLCGRVNAALSRDLQKDAQIVPFDYAPAHTVTFALLRPDRAAMRSAGTIGHSMVQKKDNDCQGRPWLDRRRRSLKQQCKCCVRMS